MNKLFCPSQTAAGGTAARAEPVPQDAWSVLMAYHSQQHCWPTPVSGRQARTPRAVSDLGAILGEAEAILTDAFGVLNVGESALPGAPEALQAVRQRGCALRVVSNAASQPKAALVARYRAMGFDLTAAEFITSRDVTLQALAEAPAHWRWVIIAPGQADLSDLPIAHGRRWDGALHDGDDAVLFLAAWGWQASDQEALEAGLRASPRPVWVANPDLISPWGDAWRPEPGGWCTGLQERTGATVLRFGKPLGSIFELALASLPGAVERARVWMLGDTLHTDILGAQAVGLRTAWITGAGASTGLDVARAVACTGIVPDVVMPFIGPVAVC
ncbi:MAG: HAD hydrolase-like protein [Tepidimonas sp.]|uniref:HAD-IIA family hydrolase n=1 Tax=Tepidimonas sp. TaxID=2002775 RepID=UPI00259EF7ED|nr:HAD hydrolase-like protein [Tepidimonas sp.]MDM7456807.1 HAD hydrolase-like protein [Tepidimonas sp.]